MQLFVPSMPLVAKVLVRLRNGHDAAEHRTAPRPLRFVKTAMAVLVLNPT